MTGRKRLETCTLRLVRRECNRRKFYHGIIRGTDSTPARPGQLSGQHLFAGNQGDSWDISHQSRGMQSTSVIRGTAKLPLVQSLTSTNRSYPKGSRRIWSPAWRSNKWLTLVVGKKPSQEGGRSESTQYSPGSKAWNWNSPWPSE